MVVLIRYTDAQPTNHVEALEALPSAVSMTPVRHVSAASLSPVRHVLAVVVLN
jgi:hypothetical protein